MATLFFHLKAIKERPDAPDYWAHSHGIFKPASEADYHRMRHIIADLEVDGHRFRAFNEKELNVMVMVRACSYGKAEWYHKQIGMPEVVDEIWTNPNNKLQQLPKGSVLFHDWGTLEVSEGGPQNAFVNIEVDKRAWNTIISRGGTLQVANDSWKVYFEEKPLFLVLRRFPDQSASASAASSSGPSSSNQNTSAKPTCQTPVAAPAALDDVDGGDSGDMDTLEGGEPHLPSGGSAPLAAEVESPPLSSSDLPNSDVSVGQSVHEPNVRSMQTDESQ